MLFDVNGAEQVSKLEYKSYMSLSPQQGQGSAMYTDLVLLTLHPVLSSTAKHILGCQIAHLLPIELSWYTDPAVVNDQFPAVRVGP